MSDTIVCDFVFVPNGAPFPADWVRRHPNYITLPARFTGSPAFMERMVGKRRSAGRHVFDKAASVPASLGPTEASRTEGPLAVGQSQVGFEASAAPTNKLDIAAVASALRKPSAGHNTETSKRDIWTGLSKEELLGPGLAYLERHAGGDGTIDFVAGLGFGLDDAQLITVAAKSLSADIVAVRIAPLAT